MPRTLANLPPHASNNILFLPCTAPLPPSKWMSYVYHPYIYYRNGWRNFNFFAGTKWVVFPKKNMGKNHKAFSRNLKQLRVKLHGINWKTFGLASWKQSELNVKMKRKTGSSLWISTAWYWLWWIEEYPLVGERTLPSSLRKNEENCLKYIRDWLLLAS